MPEEQPVEGAVSIDVAAECDVAKGTDNPLSESLGAGLLPFEV